MTYYIFLKSLTSLEEFRKNPHVKIPPKSPCANFQSLGILKNQILFGKEFSPSLSAHPAFQPSLFFYRPIFPPLPHWASASWPAQHTRTAQPATCFLLPHRRQARTALPPAGLTPPPPEEKITAASIPIISPLLDAISPLQ
jgi:hypothetical protein